MKYGLISLILAILRHLEPILRSGRAGRGDFREKWGRPLPKHHFIEVTPFLDAFVRVLRRVLAKYGLEKEDVAICYEAGPALVDVVSYVARERGQHSTPRVEG